MVVVVVVVVGSGGEAAGERPAAEDGAASIQPERWDEKSELGKPVPAAALRRRLARRRRGQRAYLLHGRLRPRIPEPVPHVEQVRAAPRPGQLGEGITHPPVTEPNRDPAVIAIGNVRVSDDLNGLDDRTAAVVALTIDGYSQDEIAEMLDLPSVRAVEGILVAGVGLGLHDRFVDVVAQWVRTSWTNDLVHSRPVVVPLDR